MKFKKKILCIIPARAGSVGILKKNIKIFNNKPLIYWSIIESLKSKYIDRVIVSTNSNKIKTISEKYGAQVPFLRPENISKNNSNVINAINHVLINIEEKYDIVVILQPTSPLRKVVDIDKSIKIFIEKKMKSLVSITKLEHPYEWIMKKSKNNKIKFIKNKLIYQRQKTLDYFIPNGSIFIVDINHLKKSKSLYTDETYGYEMKNIDSIDIDNINQFKFAEFIMKNK